METHCGYAGSVDGDTHSFIVRIWRDSTDTRHQEIGWRGSIDDVGSGKRLYFQDLESIAEFIQEQSGAFCPPASEWWKALWRRVLLIFGKRAG